METTCPVKLESCIRSMLYDYRYRDNKDFFICSISKIKTAFRSCIKSITCVNEAKGGSKPVRNKLEGKLLLLKKK